MATLQRRSRVCWQRGWHCKALYFYDQLQVVSDNDTVCLGRGVEGGGHLTFVTAGMGKLDRRLPFVLEPREPRLGIPPRELLRPAGDVGDPLRTSVCRCSRIPSPSPIRGCSPPSPPNCWALSSVSRGESHAEKRSPLHTRRASSCSSMRVSSGRKERAAMPSSPVPKDSVAGRQPLAVPREVGGWPQFSVKKTLPTEKVASG